MHDIINQNISKKKRKKNFKFSQELQKDTSVQTLSPSIHLGGWARHFEDEYIIKPSKNLIESWKTNEWSQCSLKGSRPLSVESNAEFQTRDSLI